MVSLTVPVVMSRAECISFMISLQSEDGKRMLYLASIISREKENEEIKGG